MYQIIRRGAAVGGDNIVHSARQQAICRGESSDVRVSLDLRAGIVHGSSNEELIRQNVRLVPGCIIANLEVDSVTIRRNEADLLCERPYVRVQRIRIRK